MKGQIYLSSDKSTYIPVCLSTPLQRCPLLLERASVIDTPQGKFISRDFLRVSPSEFVLHTLIKSEQYCSRLASHCDSNLEATTRLCWKGTNCSIYSEATSLITIIDSVSFGYIQNNVTLFEEEIATFSYLLYCSMCNVAVNFVWKRGETTLRQRTRTTLKVVKNFTYRLYGAKKTDSGLYTFRIVVGDNVYSNSFFVTVLEGIINNLTLVALK